MKIFSRFILVCILSLFAFSLFHQCANKVPPSGGKKDTIPPSLIYSNPKHQSINVHTRVYEFRFSEKLKLNNLKRTLIITPRIDFSYEIKPGKRSLILVFEENFKDSTTYTFNFRDAIQDVTEGNPTTDNIFTFSTGKHIDSLSIEGYAIGLLKRDTLKTVTVGLYNATDTTTILNGSPYYFTETDEKGYFKLNNIKNGKYLIYGFKDANSNLKLETKNEPYAFKEDTLILQDNLDSINLYFVNHDIRDLKIQTALPSGKHFDINFTKYISHFQIKPLQDSIRVYANRVKENRSVRIYNTFYAGDSTAFYISAIDSTHNFLEDTVWARFNESKRKSDEFTFSIKPENGESISENFTADLKFNKPVALVDRDSIYFRLDTLIISGVTTREQILANHNLTHFQVKFKLNKQSIDSIQIELDSMKARQQRIQQDSLVLLDSLTDTIDTDPDFPRATTKKTIKQSSQTQKTVASQGLNLYLGKTSFISVEGDSLQRSAFKYQFIDSKMTGTVSGKVSTESKHFLQLLNERDEVVQELYSISNFRFANIKPGNYKLRLLIDKNENRRWDYGNLLKGEEPEPVVYYISEEGSKTISVRANWDITDINIEY